MGWLTGDNEVIKEKREVTKGKVLGTGLDLFPTKNNEPVEREEARTKDEENKKSQFGGMIG